jgi:hypothetical protein
MERDGKGTMEREWKGDIACARESLGKEDKM